MGVRQLELHGKLVMLALVALGLLLLIQSAKQAFEGQRIDVLTIFQLKLHELEDWYRGPDAAASEVEPFAPQEWQVDGDKVTYVAEASMDSGDSAPAGVAGAAGAAGSSERQANAFII